MKLLRTPLFLFFALVNALPLLAEPIDSVFARAPQRVLPLLSLNARLDMLDLYNYQMTAQGENRYGGNSLLLTKTDNHLVVQLTEASRWELLRTAAGTDSTRYACIYTVTRPDSVSRLTIYNKEWEPLPARLLNYQPVDFLFSSNGQSAEGVLPDSLSTELRTSLLAKLPQLPVYMEWEAPETSQPRLSMQLSTASFSKEEQAALRPWLRRISIKY